MNKKNKQDESLIKIEANLPFYIFLTTVLIIALIITLLFILSLEIDPKHGQWNIDFAKAGQIGDLISGISTPIIGLFSALLIYYSFKAQIRANMIVLDQLDNSQLEQNFIFLLNELDKVAKEINNYKFDNSSGNLAYTSLCNNLDTLLKSDFDRNSTKWKSSTNNSLTIINKRIVDIQFLLTQTLISIVEFNMLELNENHTKILKNRYKLFYYAHLNSILLILGKLDYTIVNNWDFDINDLNYEARRNRINTVINVVDQIKTNSNKIKKHFKGL